MDMSVNNHSRNFNGSRCEYLFEKMRKGRNNDPLCDAIIKVENEEFPIHKIVLTSNSTYFEAMFTSPFNEQNAECINLNGVTSKVFAILLDYMYGANIQFSEETMLAVYQAADMFCINSLTMECIEYVKRDMQNFEKNPYTLVELMNDEKIEKAMLDEITYKYMISKDEKLAIDLPFSYIEKLIEKAILEKTVLNLIYLLIKWVVCDPKQRLRHVEYIARSVSLNLLPWSTIEDFQSKMEALFDQENLLEEKERFKKLFKSKCDRLKRRIISLLGSNFYTVFVEEYFEAKIDCFNCADFKWKPRDELSLPFVAQDCLYKSGSIYFMGNKISICYTLNTKNVAFLEEMEIGRIGYLACFLENDIIIAGGVKENSTNVNVEEILFYQTCFDTWGPPIMTWFQPHIQNSVITQGKNVFIVGAKQYLTEIFKFNLNEHTFSKVCEFSQNFVEPHLTIYDNKLYVFTQKNKSKGFKGYITNVVDLEREELVNSTNNSTHCNFQENDNDLKMITLKGTFSTREGILLISSINLNRVDQLYLELLNSSGKVETIGFLPHHQHSFSTSTTNKSVFCDNVKAFLFNVFS